MTYIPDPLRRLVIERADNCCEYCLIHQRYRLYPHEVNHIIAEKHRGQTNAENLCLSCFICNRHKGTDFASFDPETDEVALLFHPRRDKWEDHFGLDKGRIMPLTPQGRVTVFLLKFNDKVRLEQRADLTAIGRYPPQR